MDTKKKLLNNFCRVYFYFNVFVLRYSLDTHNDRCDDSIHKGSKKEKRQEYINARPCSWCQEFKGQTRLERLLELEQTIWGWVEGEYGSNRRGEDKETQVEHTWWSQTTGRGSGRDKNTWGDKTVEIKQETKSTEPTSLTKACWTLSPAEENDWFIHLQTFLILVLHKGMQKN